MSCSRPKVTIGMPVYNGEAFIEEALESLCAQTYTDFELIISDNASTDRTESICRRFAERDSRIRYDRLAENLGAVPNFNRVFELSDSKYFKWAAADDICAPTFLARCVELLESDSSVVWCHTHSSHIDSEGRVLDDPDAIDVSYPGRDSQSAYHRFSRVLLGRGGCLDSYALIRSDAIRQTPLILPYYGAEKVFIAELALQGRYREVPEILFFARVHAGSAGNLETAADQQAYMNTHSNRLEWTRWRLLRGYVSAVVRAPVSVTDKLKCLTAIARYLLQVGKWKSVVMNTLRGAGIRGGNVDRIKRLEQRASNELDRATPPGLDARSASPIKKAADPTT